MRFWEELLVDAVRFAGKTKEAVLNVATAGGHNRLKQTKENYEWRFRDYKASQDAFNSAKSLLESAKANLDISARNSVNLLRDAREVVQRLSWQSTTSSLPKLSVISMPKMENVDRVLTEINTAAESGKGTGIGAAAGAGAWLLVAHLGTASTGAAIGGLSGAAATNAILAWFGGGALAAGGGGMALGGFVLGGIALLPAIAFGAYRSYKEADRIDEESQKALSAEAANQDAAKSMRALVPKVDALKVWTDEQNELFSAQLLLFRDRALTMAQEIASISDRFAQELSAQTEMAV